MFAITGKETGIKLTGEKTVDALHDMNYSQYITYKGVYERTKAALGGLRKAAGSHICLRQKLCQVRQHETEGNL